MFGKHNTKINDNSTLYGETTPAFQNANSGANSGANSDATGGTNISGAGTTEKGANKMFKFFSKAGIKKFVLILYCIVPLLIVSIGFAAWTIVGQNLTGASGSFTAYDIINSYDYIQINTTSVYGIDFYATGFYDNGSIVNTIGFDIEYTLDMGNCYKLAKDSNGSLYATFELYFSDNTKENGYPKFFKNLVCKVAVSDVTETTGTIELEKEKATSSITNQNTQNIEISEKGDISLDTDKYSDSASYPIATGYSHYLFLKINPTSSNAGKIKLKLTYTLEPDSNDYQTLYNLIKNLSKQQLMVDVRITD